MQGSVVLTTAMCLGVVVSWFLVFAVCLSVFELLSEKDGEIAGDVEDERKHRELMDDPKIAERLRQFRARRGAQRR